MKQFKADFPFERFKQMVEKQKKLDAARFGEIDRVAYEIVESIYAYKVPDNPKTFLVGGVKLKQAPRPNDPLEDDQQKRILKAVRDLDQPFFRSLIKAMNLWESGSGVKTPVAFKVIESYRHLSDFHNDHSNPTAAEVMESLKFLHPDFSIEERTIRLVCKKAGLKLKAKKPGRPSKLGSARKSRS